MLQRSKRWISLLLAVILSASMLIMPVSAAETAAPSETQEPETTGSVLEAILNPTPIEEIVEEEPALPVEIELPQVDGTTDIEKDLAGYKSYVYNVLSANSAGQPGAQDGLDAIQAAESVEEIEASMAAMIESNVFLGYEAWVTAGKPSGEFLADYQTYVKVCITAAAPEGAEALAAAVDGCTTVAAIEALTGVDALITAEKCLSYTAWLAAGKPTDAPGAGGEDEAARELAAYQAYVKVCITAAAPEGAEALATAVDGCATTGEIEALEGVLALITAEKCLGYTAWVAAERPTEAPGPSQDEIAADLAAYKTYVKAYLAASIQDGDEAAAEAGKVDACETAEAVEGLESVKALIEGKNTCLGYDEWLTAGKPEATPDAVVYTVTYYDGKTVLATEDVVEGKKPAETPEKNSAGGTIAGWFTASSSFASPAETAVTKDVAYYVWYAPVLETEAHNRYINGIGSNMFNPAGTLTRYEAVTILYNLMVSKEKGPYEVSFPDVSQSHWACEAVETLASYMVLNGYSDGRFYGYMPVTRAQFVTMLARIHGITAEESSFTDVSGWSEAYIATAEKEGWVNGRGEGIFDPTGNITRYEAVIIMNRFLGRSPDKETISAARDMVAYTDMKTSYWFYWDVMEASVSHTYSKASGTETWTEYIPEESGLEPGFHTINDKLYYVSSETKQMVYLDAGINKADGLFLYASNAGYEVTLNLSAYLIDNNLASHIYKLEEKVFYWDSEKQEVQYLTKGVNKIAGRGYYASEDGYLIQTGIAENSVVELDGKLYISGTNDTIIISYYDYANSADPTNPDAKDLAGTTYEFKQNMYYVKEDYSLARDEWIGYLSFDENGKYTTGDATLDAYVYNAIYDIINNNALTPVQKLMKVYYRIRGGEGATPGTAMLRYRSWNDGYARRRYNGQYHYTWLINVAKKSFETRAGSCYYWGGMYLYMARRLGFQSYAVVGNVWQDQPKDAVPRHCWCMIYWDGKWHISDVEVEWGYLVGYYTYGVSYYYNLFDQTVAHENISSYTNPEWSTVKYFFKNE